MAGHNCVVLNIIFACVPNQLKNSWIMNNDLKIQGRTNTYAARCLFCRHHGICTSITWPREARILMTTYDCVFRLQWVNSTISIHTTTIVRIVSHFHDYGKMKMDKQKRTQFVTECMHSNDELLVHLINAESNSCRKILNLNWETSKWWNTQPIGIKCCRKSAKVFTG